MARALPTGIALRHSRSCKTTSGSDCACKPTYATWVYDAREKRKIKKTFPTLAAAKAWRADAQVALRRGEIKAPTRVTLHEAGDAWLEAAERGEIRNKSGDVYKPSALRSYRRVLEQRVFPELGWSPTG